MKKCPVCGKEMTIWEKDLEQSNGMPDHDVPFWYCLNRKEYHEMVIIIDGKIIDD